MKLIYEVGELITYYGPTHKGVKLAVILSDAKPATKEKGYMSEADSVLYDIYDVEEMIVRPDIFWGWFNKV